MAAVDDDGSGRQQQRMTTTATADDDCGERQRWRMTRARKIEWQTTRGKEESGRQTTTVLDKRLISPLGRECERIKKSSLRKKDFFQQYGLSGWIFCSR
jgi:hypothetical protein